MKLLMQSGRSLINNINNKGPRTDPCGIPDRTFIKLEKLPSTHTLEFFFSNLLESIDSVLSLLVQGCPVDVFYMYFCKAFDSVPHHRLLTKMEAMCITGTFFAIINNFQSDRTEE